MRAGLKERGGGGLGPLQFSCSKTFGGGSLLGARGILDYDT